MIKRPFIRFFSPVLSYVSLFVQEVEETFSALIHFYSLKKENKRLENTIAELKRQLMENQEIRLENIRLHGLFHFKSKLNFSVTAARIVGQDPSNWYNGIIVDKGNRHGIEPDQVVLSLNGVVGKVMEVYKNNAKIMLLSDKNSQIGGLVLRTRDIGVLQGKGGQTCVLDYLPRASDVKPTDMIISSGLDNRFPKGLLLGEVTAVYSEKSGLYKYAEVKSSVEFDKLEEVLIIINKNKASGTRKFEHGVAS